MVKDQEVERVAKKLDKMVHKKNTDGAIDLLRELKNMKMSLETLQVCVCEPSMCHVGLHNHGFLFQSGNLACLEWRTVCTMSAVSRM
ncbi:transcription elongation factor A protein 2-like [Carassius auratus]|uniref:Transcription elongation factor A protein 2-like n=1 Tax=Carassius auratus TaxID=7957 RepID=A0A6P6PJE4_CARAU|nr:transcription elongation factor A protein 2-like [Carassius auratus]